MEADLRPESAVLAESVRIPFVLSCTSSPRNWLVSRLLVLQGGREAGAGLLEKYAALPDDICIPWPWFSTSLESRRGEWSGKGRM